MRTAFVVVASLLQAGCATWFTAHSSGLVDGRLTACPSPPRCVSSDASDERHAIEAYRITGDPAAAWAEALAALCEIPRLTVVAQSPDYVHAEITSPWGTYTDDLELQLRADEGVIAVRSSGRIGYYDFEVNRERVEALRQCLSARGAVSAAR